MFWPREIWGEYAHELEDFKYPQHRTSAVQCLNNMVRGQATYTGQESRRLVCVLGLTGGSRLQRNPAKIGCTRHVLPMGLYAFVRAGCWQACVGSGRPLFSSG